MIGLSRQVSMAKGLGKKSGAAPQKKILTGGKNMLVTKREVRQTSKKLLSVLLAVIMIMTSMSVCFGTFTTASAANIGSDFSGYTADAFEYLAEHLNGATVKKYTDKYNIGTGSANSTNNVEYITDIKTDTYEEY